MRRFIIYLCWNGVLLLGALHCGGREQAPPSPPRIAPLDSEQGVDLVRASFKAIGGLERLRLIGSRASMMMRAVVSHEVHSVAITFIGADNWRLDYAEEDVSYLYDHGACHKVVYGILARCWESEERWMEPMKLWIALVLPSADAANIQANFRLRGEKVLGGEACHIVELRPLDSNLRLRGFYAKKSNLLKLIEFELEGDGPPPKVTWSMSLDDWREVEGVKLPFARILKRDEEVVSEEEIVSFILEAAEDAFSPPPPPTTGVVLEGTLPPRSLSITEFDGLKVELPAPPIMLGGAPEVAETREQRSGSDILYVLFKGGLAEVSSYAEMLSKSAAERGREPASKPQVMLLEQLSKVQDPALIMVYLSLTTP